MPPLFIAFLVVLLEALAFGAILPVIGLFTTQLGGGAALTGVMLAAVSLPKVVTNPIFGRLSDRYGRRPVLMVNTVGTLVGSIGWAIAGNLGWLLAARLITGVFSAQAGVCQAIAADVSPAEHRSSAMALLGAAFGMAFGLGPLLGGWVAAAASYAAVGWLCAGLQALSLLSIALFLPETRPIAEAVPLGERSGVWPAAVAAPRRLLARPRVRALLAITVLITIAQSAMIATLPFMAGATYAFDAAHIGYCFAVIGGVAIVIQGGAIRPLVARLGDRTTAMLGSALVAGGLGAIAARPPLPGFWAALIILAMGTALAAPCLTAMLSRSVSPAEQGAINGYQQSSLGVGRGAGNLAGGWLHQHFGPGVPYAAAAALALVSSLLLATRSASRDSQV